MSQEHYHWEEKEAAFLFGRKIFHITTDLPSSKICATARANALKAGKQTSPTEMTNIAEASIL